MGTSADVDRSRRGPRAVERAVRRGSRSRSRRAAPRSTLAEALVIVDRVGYPVLVRPSYVLGGRAMEIVYDDDSLDARMERRLALRQPRASKEGSRPNARCSSTASSKTPPRSMSMPSATTPARSLIGAVMEHVEEAGVHSGDCACVIPPPHLSPDTIAVIEDYTRRIAEALDVRGLVNVQYAVKGNQVFVIEANPRASRTVPFVAKATGVPLVKIAARVMLGATLDELPRPRVCSRAPVVGDHVAVKEAVLPFNRFPEADAVLGPEMRSTGEVMGIDLTTGLAFMKSQIAAGGPLPDEGTVLPVAGRSRQGARLRGGRTVPPARLLARRDDRHRGGARGGRHRRSPSSWPSSTKRATTASISSTAARSISSSTAPRSRPPSRRCAHPRGGATQQRAAAHHRVGGAGRGARHGRLVASPAAGAHAAGVPRGCGERAARARAMSPGVDLATTVGSVSLPNPMMTGVRHRRARCRARPLPRPLVARCDRRQVAVGRAVGGQPGAACARDGRRDDQQRRPAGPGRRGLARRRAAGAPADRRPRRREHLGAHRRRLRASRRGDARRAPPRSWPSRSTCRVRTSKTAAMFAHSASATVEVIAAPPACRRPMWAKLSPNVHDLVEIADAAAGAGPRRSRSSTPCWRWSSTPTPAVRGWVRCAAGCPDRPSIRSRCGRSSTATRRCRICPSSGSAV